MSILKNISVNTVITAICLAYIAFVMGVFVGHNEAISDRELEINRLNAVHGVERGIVRDIIHGRFGRDIH
jgi:hypothetical protein